jgi:excisionase family DNA binding protein
MGELKLLTTETVAEMLRVTPKTIREMAKDGRLPSVRVGRLYRFDPREIHRLFFSTAPSEGSRSLKTERDLKLVSIQSLKKNGSIEWL